MISKEGLLYFKRNKLEVPPVVLPEHLWALDKKGKPKSEAQRRQEADDYAFVESLGTRNQK